MFGTSPAFPDAGFVPCLAAAFHFPYGLYGLGLCIGALALLILMVMRMGYSEGGEYDRRRNLVYSNKGTYGTAGFMSRKELTEVLDLVPDIRKHSGTILGELDHQVICIPPKTRFNGNLAVYGASGSKKTRAFCVNMILQCAARKSSLVICDPKSELYEKTSEYLRDQGYTVRVFNLVTPSASDSWNCLAEVGGQELMAQLFCDVIIKNTGGEERDHFWDSAEMNLLKALVLYVSTSYPKEKQNIGEVYQLLTASSEKELNALFDVLPLTHPAKAPYSIFKQASEGVRGGVIIGLGSRLQVFQNKDIRNITSYEHGYWCSKSGSYHTLIPGAAQAWGLSVEGCTASEPQRILDALADGKLVVALMTKGHFTKSGHFIVLRGVQDEKILVADPASYRRSQKAWDLSIILNEASRRAGAGGPFWIIG